MRLYVTGATGYLGREVCRQAGIGAPPRVDVRDAEAVDAAIAGADAVIHTAYRRDERDVIVDGSVAVARAAARHGARLVHLSTDMVFGGAPGRALTEEDPPAPLEPYGRAKADAERAVAAAAPGAALVRTSLIYGGDVPSPSERLAQEPGDAVFYDDEIRCPIAVGDLAAAVLELATRPEVAGPLHVAGADAVSRLAFARLLAPGADLRGAPRPPGRPGDLTLDCRRARALLRTPLRGVRDVLA